MSSAASYDAPPLSLEGLQLLVATLSAEQRARLKWGPHETAEAVRAFLAAPHDESRLKELMLSLERTMEFVMPLVLDGLAAQPERFHAALEDSWHKDLETLAQQVDHITYDFADWSIRVLAGAMRAALADMSRAPRDEVVRILATRPEARLTDPAHPLRLQALLLAAVEAAKRGLSAQATVIAENAFDHAAALLSFVHAADAPIFPFEKEAQGTRSARVLRYLDDLREVATPDELDLLEATRLRQLR